MARARGYIGGDAPEFLGGGDLMVAITDPDTEIVTHVSARALGCNLPCDHSPVGASLDEDADREERLLVGAY